MRRSLPALVGLACLVVAGVARGANLVPNASFEVCRNFRHITGSAGWGRFQMVDPRTLADPKQRTWYVDDTTAYHGKKSVCIYQYLESQFVRVKAEATYTISLYAKAGAPVTVRLSFISGERTAYVPDGPRFQKEFRLSTEWQRITLTGKTEGKDPLAYAMVVEVYGRTTPVWIDAVQVEQGGSATPFAPAERVEAATQIVDETPAIGIYFKDESPRLVASVYADGVVGGAAHLVHRILDHRGAEVDRIERTARIGSDGHAVDEIRIPFRRFGAFRVETDVRVAKDQERFAAESIFLFVPRIPAEYDIPEESRFGSRFILPPFPREGAERFLPSWIGDEREILAKAGATPPYNYAVVTAKQAWKLGMRWIRWAPVWRHVEPERGVFDWADADSYIDKLDELGFKIQFQFAQSPGWSHPDKPDDRAPPDDLADWTKFLRAVATRYRGSFQAVEIWNETFSNFLGTADEYGALLKSAYETLKGVDPDTQVLGVSGCKPSYQFRMTKRILERVGTKYMDAMSYHQKLFGEMPDEMAHPWGEEIAKLHETMAASGGDRPIWNTETQCWSRPFYEKLIRGAGGYSRKVPAMSVADAASGLVRMFVVSMANNVVRFQYFGTYNSRGSVITAWTGQNLLDFPLTESLYEPDYSPKPLAAAHAALASQVAGERFVGELKLPENGRGRVFLFDGKRGALAVLWALQARTRAGTLEWGAPPGGLELYDIMGNGLEPKARMPLGAEPVYVRADSLAALKTVLGRSRVTGLPTVDRVGDAPELQACLHSADDMGNLDLVVRVVNVTDRAMRPKLKVAFAEKTLVPGRVRENDDSLDPGSARDFHCAVADSTRPAAQVNRLSIEVAGAAKPASLARTVALAYALAAKKKITVDGDLSEWGRPGVIKLGEPSRVVPNLPWGGPDDLSGEIMLRWDDANLYVGVRVTDDHLDRHPSANRIWDGTSVELFFDVDLFHDMGEAAYNDDDYHFLFAPATSPERGDIFFITDNSASTKTDGIRMKSKRTERGYDMEIALPRRIFDYEPWLGGAGRKFKKGHSFGFGLALNDAYRERTARKTILIWGGTGDNWRDISKLATVVMVGER